jgi:Protein of unknown function (DUF2934)
MKVADTINREQRVRETAYHLWEKAGRPMGQAERHWEMAERLADQAPIGTGESRSKKKKPPTKAKKLS